MRGLTSATMAGVLLLGLGTCTPTRAQGGPLIYSCNDATGKRITRDRYIAECSAREQRVLNADGSLRQVLPPTLTAEERGVADERARDVEVVRVREREAVKRDQNLLSRYPNEAAHRKARELALEDVRRPMRVSEQRLAALAKERKPLDDEAEFYVGKQLPLKLKLALDANEASVEANQSLVQNQQTEVVRIEKNYDAGLERLRLLWSGMRPGSGGAIAGVASAASSGSAPARK